MNTRSSHLFRQRRRFALLVLVPVLGLSPSLAACGEEGESTETAGTTASDPGGGAATSTDLEPGGGIPDLPDNDDPSAVQCTGEPKEVFDATVIVGEQLREATAQARAAGCDVRVVVRDGEPLAVTDDFRPDRINVAVADGIVKRIEGLY